MREARSEHSLHHELALLDAETLITDSYQWTVIAALHNREHIATYRNLRLVRADTAAFEDPWRDLAGALPDGH